MAASESRQSHWLQKALVKRWASDEGLVACLNKSLGNFRRYSPKQAASEVGFFDGIPGVSEAEIERGFGEIEDKGLPALVQLVDDPNGLSVDEREFVAVYCAMSITRSRGWRNEHLRRARRKEAEFIKDFVESGLYTEAEARAAVQEAAVEVAGQSFARHLMPVASFLLNSSWLVLRAEKAEFVISDRHGVVVDSASGGIGSDGGYTRLSHLLPILPRVVLAFDPTPEAIAAAQASAPDEIDVPDTSKLVRHDGIVRDVIVDRHLVRDINLCAIAQSDQYVFGRANDHLRALWNRAGKAGSSGERFRTGTILKGRLRLP